MPGALGPSPSGERSSAPEIATKDLSNLRRRRVVAHEALLNAPCQRARACPRTPAHLAPLSGCGWRSAPDNKPVAVPRERAHTAALAHNTQLALQPARWASR
eukprot:scaffold69769_cov75-Phaeocystis_antarctica.AAC.3